MPVDEREEYHCAVFTLCRKKNLLLAHIWAIILGKSVERERHFLCPSPSPGGLSPPVPPFLRQSGGEREERGGPLLLKKRRVVPIRAERSQGEEVHKNPLLRRSLFPPAAICYSRNPFSRYISICPHLFFCVWRERRYRKGGFPSAAKTLGFGDERHCQPIFPKRRAPRVIEEK